MTIKTLYPNVRPTLDLAFAATKALDPRITFTRASTGTYVGSNGTLRTAGINEARFDHSPLTLESLGLLVEEARTNLLLRSEEFDNASWTKTRSSVTANAITAPDRTLTGDKLIDSTDASASHFISQSISFVSGTTYTVSIFAKQDEIRYLRLGFNTTPFGTTQIVFFDLLNGVISSNPNALAASITDAGNGWWRLAVTATATATASDLILISLSLNGTSISFTGTGANGLYIWGVQLEAGASPTSYIPTTSATATRAADVASISSSAFSSWYRQDEGTVFVNATTNATHGGSNSFPRKLSISDGTNSNSIEDYYRVLASYTDAGYRIDAAGVNQAQFDTNNQRNGQSSVIGYAANNSAFAVGGTVVATDLSGTVPTTTQLRLGQRGDGSAALNGTIRRLTYWPVRLPNATLQSLTS